MNLIWFGGIYIEREEGEEERERAVVIECKKSGIRGGGSFGSSTNEHSFI